MTPVELIDRPAREARLVLAHLRQRVSRGAIVIEERVVEVRQHDPNRTPAHKFKTMLNFPASAPDFGVTATTSSGRNWGSVALSG